MGVMDSIFKVSPPANQVEDYRFGKHIMAYLDQKVEPWGKVGAVLFKDQREAVKDRRKALMLASGYANPNKFKAHQIDWHELSRPVPKKYLDAIGIDRKTLELMVELDHEEFERALALPRYPKGITIRLMPAVYSYRELPPGTTEAEALEAMRKTVMSTGLRSCINYPELLTIYVEKEGNCVINREPKITETATMISFGRAGHRVGMTSVR